MQFVPLRRIRTHRNADKDSHYRWYNDYALSDTTLTIRLHQNAEDDRHRLNRTENVRPIPPGDPDFEQLFPLRNDAESINRSLDDTLHLRRAHSIGHARQLLNLLGFAIMTNTLAVVEHPQPNNALAT